MRYYVYILLDPRYDGEYNNRFCKINFKPFYVGKGDKFCKNKSDRHLQHYKEVLNKKKDLKISNIHKFRIIKKLFSLNYEPLFKIIFESANEDDVFEIEKEIIDFYGKSSQNGILTNLTNGGVGGDTFTNNPRKEEIREKHRKNSIGEKNNMYGLELEQRLSYIAKKKRKSLE